MSMQAKHPNIVIKCIWNQNLVCEKGRSCDACEYQPAADKKKNGKNAPVKIKWQEDYSGTYPVCPSCGEMPYSTERCVFCGQKFLQKDQAAQEFNQPTSEERMDCFLCGGKNTMVGHRARCNGHFHGYCENCGAKVIE